MNAQAKKKSLTDDSSLVDSVGKDFAGYLSAYYPWCALFEIPGCLTSFDCGIRDVNAQGKRKSLTDDSLRVESVGKVFAGQLLAYYPRCALFEISGCLTS